MSNAIKKRDKHKNMKIAQLNAYEIKKRRDGINEDIFV